LSFVSQLKQRKVFKIGAAYLVVAWLMVQAASIAFPAFDAPLWALRVFILATLLGLPIAVVMAWVFDVTPEGVKLDASASGSKRLFAVAGVLVVLALGWYFYGQPSFRRGDMATPAQASAPAVAAVAAPRKSIAVLAFSDLSPTHDQEYFSDGMSEEILNALAQVKDLKVAGRTSSFQFKGRNEDLRTIGRALGVAHILEGSVRKQGDKVRITAQLIRVADDTHLWSHAYDGDLKDVFQLQENIARAITDQLQVVLEGGQKARLVPVSTSSPDAYSLYLQATSIFDRRDSPRFDEAIADLQQALKLDPKYARAHSRLAALYVVQSSYNDFDLTQSHALVLQHARAALALDPGLAEPYAAMGVSYSKLPGGYLKQREAIERALQLDPDDVTSNFWSGLALITTGYRARGIALFDHALVIDPMLPNAVRWRGIVYLRAGDLDRAEQLLKRARATGLSTADGELAEIACARGDAATAIRQWPNGWRNQLRALPPGSPEMIAAGMCGDAGARQRALALLDGFLAKPRSQMSGAILMALVKLGQPRRALELLRETRFTDSSDFFALLWSPAGKSLRALPEFPAFVREMGFVELWDKYGAPDDCRRTAPARYVCD
jgi:TolB-like protein/Tfp pilus assembly protein PilF